MKNEELTKNINKHTQSVFLRHFGARAVALIVLPMFIYMLMFQIHFHSLPNSGEGDGFMSPEFQQTLDGHTSIDTPIDIAFGSKVFIRHVATRGGYLHSHPHNYPSGSKREYIYIFLLPTKYFKVFNPKTVYRTTGYVISSS